MHLMKLPCILLNALIYTVQHSSHTVQNTYRIKYDMPVYAIYCSKGLASLSSAEHAVLCYDPISYTSIHVSKLHPNILLPGSSKQYRAVLRSESKLYVNWTFSKQIIIIRSTCSVVSAFPHNV